jgi:hypothetical protein
LCDMALIDRTRKATGPRDAGEVLKPFQLHD